MDRCDRCGSELPRTIPARALPAADARERDAPARPVVLVADDSELVRRVAETVLSAAGYRVVLSVDGASALAAAHREDPDVVVLDLLMPNLTGFDVLREMKRSERLRWTPVLMMSGVYKENVVGFLARLGAQGFIDKESLEENLAFRMRSVLDDRAAAGGGRREKDGSRLCPTCVRDEDLAAPPESRPGLGAARAPKTGSV